MQIARFVMDWLSRTPSLRGRLAAGLVSAFAESGSWNFTRSVVPYLEGIDVVTDDQLSRMEAAATDNVNVRGCDIGGQSGPRWVEDYVAKRRGTPDTPIWPSPDEPPF